jgi:hypothetical protein
MASRVDVCARITFVLPHGNSLKRIINHGVMFLKSETVLV